MKSLKCVCTMTNRVVSVSCESRLRLIVCLPGLTTHHSPGLLQLPTRTTSHEPHAPLTTHHSPGLLQLLTRTTSHEPHAPLTTHNSPLTSPPTTSDQNDKP